MKESKKILIISAKHGIQFLGVKLFLEKIVMGNNCFICAESCVDKSNNEHVIPNWLLKKHNLHSKFITLSNSRRTKYSSYTIQCCEKCNSALGEHYEKPISKILSGTYEEILEKVKNDHNTVKLIFRWLSLIFIKTHLKDKEIKENPDNRVKSPPLSEKYYWEELHHIHCIARSHYTGPNIDDDVYGTTIILPTYDEDDNYDYMDNLAAKSIMLKSGSFCIISVLDDSCACLSVYLDELKRIQGPLNDYQLREVFAKINYISINLKERPKFSSKIEKNGQYRISADSPKTIYLVDFKDRIESPGKFLRFYIEKLVDIENEDQKELMEKIDQGTVSFLFDKDNNFVNNPKNTKIIKES